MTVIKRAQIMTLMYSDLWSQIRGGLLFESFEVGFCHSHSGGLKPAIAGQQLLPEGRQPCPAATRASRIALYGRGEEGSIETVDQQPCALVVHTHRPRRPRNRAGRLHTFEQCRLAGADSGTCFRYESKSEVRHDGKP